MVYGKSDAIMSNSNMRHNVTSVTPIYSYVFEFEKKFSPEKARAWMDSNWTNGFYFCGIYLLLVFSLKHYMKDRTRLNLRKILITWNTMLAVFSLIGSARTLPELFHVLSNYGIYHSVCVPSFIESDKVAGFWTWMFALSKLPELGDTVFVVLRKQPLIFLHWYHHITVLLYTWYAYKEYTSSARWFIVMNYCVHSLMYSYYALRAMGFFPPRFIMMLITSLQITQMVIGCLVNYWSYVYLTNNQACHITYLNIKLSTCMYFSYFVLFAQFFYKAYFSKSGKKKPSSIPGSIYTSNKDDKIKSQ
ncbi:very long chain fatty acid elongase 6-like isoform X1 [Planococcus citri]|uniref:very long chain fatty acid elongase 6-like isoform X1 n=1 Tax=Planococcus citri TaxID=170843 RepID=UPI0031F820B3